ncbi:slr6057 (plasmid) [Synechocystis sp. PCC 6803]|jgi:Zn-dependent peptidase ImmA (M78 family)|uniref:Slr6057 protein n=1 Tax=Synechocystis sp. (strain ATCC 27184 / PCC 6803 / Kazusa) TaxID=1111708 RepID=Q6YRU7_SYNY3|nr:MULTISPECIES: ImmA/IrrE family metallo-endopeptidase [unclassified Synechocystis]AGF53766.1 hypothetical protein MYO_3580 [Synechocystis sp. PCC 6803]AVP91737.1 ImmA/IrrE family metallo-endopeptidase [Synechocystis sp. IPPAS B-1465]MBD2620041.1 ImmA/IrrE family metallo-endopeptidase [Synechocystis sp. FACHB-898]MBD2638799.1 ImmA/IrrE family metallo-endopeptidase [Synechocystis sp. FACHB-908]MBD2662689.1 ImmA/IrrE family metallo-endopeptidase [Synechocystis sp. FACHB-929]
MARRKQPKYRYGFKSEANGYAREFREELGLKPIDPLCPWSLADYLAIPVEPLSAYKDMIPKSVEYYRNGKADGFSAITIIDGYKRLIIHNDAHHPRRQAANIAHELSHGILGHMPQPVLDENGCRHFNQQEEDEAEWLGPALLISEEAALHIVKTGMDINDAVRHYGVSKNIVQMRINVTGAKNRVARMSDTNPS